MQYLKKKYLNLSHETLMKVRPPLGRGGSQIYQHQNLLVFLIIILCMFVGECKNGVSFAKVLPFEIIKLRDVLPFDQDEIEKLSVDISTRMNGNMVLPSGYAVMWKWSNTPTRHFIIVWKQISGMSAQQSAEIDKVKEL